MEAWRKTNWYAVHAKSAREGSAAANVSALGVEVLLPTLKKERLRHGVPKPLIAPLFPGYFFARFCPEALLESVRYARGVLRIVSTGRFPIPLADDIIQSIRARIGEDGYISLGRPRLQRGTEVTIQAGPFEGFIGRVEQELSGNARVVLLLEALQCARVVMEKRWLAVAASC